MAALPVNTGYGRSDNSCDLTGHSNCETSIEQAIALPYRPHYAAITLIVTSTLPWTALE